jgi:type IV pilus assembly protein PilA
MRYVTGKKGNTGFTLIELMIVVAIIGILAVLAIFGVRKYLASAKSAEATNSIGAINRGAVAAYEREGAPAELAIGASQSPTHQLCTDSSLVPAAAPANVKYTPNPAAGNDYQTGSGTAGWKCVRFELTQPQYYAYAYTSPGGVGSAATRRLATAVTVPSPAHWFAEAAGDLNGDLTLSNFVTGGAIMSGQPVTFTQVAIQDPEE